MKLRVIINKLSLQTFRILRVVAHSLGFYFPCIHIGCKHAEEAVRFAEVHYRQRATDTGSGFSCNNHIAVANCTHCYVMYLKSYLLQMHIQEVKPSPTTQKRPTGQNIWTCPWCDAMLSIKTYGKFVYKTVKRTCFRIWGLMPQWNYLF